MKEKEAIERITETAKVHRNTRSAQDAEWAMSLVYYDGPQWGFTQRDNGNIIVRSLTRMVDPDKGDVRVTLNFVRRIVRKSISVTNPQRIAADVKTATKQTYGRTSDKLLERFLYSAGGLTKWREANRIRTILGAAAIGRSLRAIGGKQVVTKAQGRRPEVNVRRFRVGWDVIYPWEFIRDPASQTAYVARDEQIVGVEKPRTAEWIKSNLKIDVTTECTMGKLWSYNDEIAAARAGKKVAMMSESQQKGVMVGQWCLQDPNDERDWPIFLMTIRDPAKDRNKYETVEIGGGKVIANPFHGLPWSFLMYDTGIIHQWPKSLPWLMMEEQDEFNSARSWIDRTMQRGGGKWVLEKQSVDDPSRALSPDPMKWIEYKRVSQFTEIPKLIPGPQLPQAAMEIANSMPASAREAAGLADVQFGLPAGKHGESGQAIDTRLQQASSVIEDSRVEDELTLGELLKNTLIDVIRLYTVDDLSAMLGPEIPMAQVMELKRLDPADEILAVSVHPATLRPRLPDDVQQEFTALAAQQVIAPEQAAYEMWEQGRRCINTPMKNALEKQEAEIDEILRTAQPMPPSIGENHPYHLMGTARFMDSKRWMDVPEQLKQIIVEHHIAHLMAMQSEQQLIMQMSGPQGAGQPSAPGAAFKNGNQAAGNVESAISVA